MLTFVQFIAESAPPKRITWIYHPKFGTVSSGRNTPEGQSREHSDLVNTINKKHPVPYDYIHKGRAYLKNGRINALHYADRTTERHDNQLDPHAIADHLAKKYKAHTVNWHQNSYDAIDDLRETDWECVNKAAAEDPALGYDDPATTSPTPSPVKNYKSSFATL